MSKTQTKDSTTNDALQVRVPTTNEELMQMSEAEELVTSFITNLEEFLSTPFVQPTALAQNGTPFTILRCGERIGTRVGSDEEISQLLFLITLEGEIEYKTKSGEIKVFNVGDNAVLALTSNRVREKLWGQIRDVINRYGQVSHMAARELKPSKLAASKGLGPTITLCHATQWRAI